MERGNAVTFAPIAVRRARPAPAGPKVAAALLVGAAVAVSLGVYARVHPPSGRPTFTLGFSSLLPMKAWLTTGALLLIVVQLLTALWMWGRLPGAGRAPRWVVPLHRWAGTAAFVLTLPVAFHCIWSLGFTTGSTRVIVHSVAGCAFYGAYATKMTFLRTPRLPRWALPLAGAIVLVCVVLLWLTASLWFFTRAGIPKV
jgi:hypothetical protein